MSYHGGGGGFDHLASYLAHAAVWSFVSRLIRHVPWPVAVLVALLASLVVARRGIRRRSRRTG